MIPKVEKSASRAAREAHRVAMLNLALLLHVTSDK